MGKIMASVPALPWMTAPERKKLGISEASKEAKPIETFEPVSESLTMQLPETTSSEFKLVAIPFSHIGPSAYHQWLEPELMNIGAPVISYNNVDGGIVYAAPEVEEAVKNAIISWASLDA